MPACYPAPDLTAFASALLARAGLETDKAGTVAEILVEGDLLGHTTHGFALLPAYLKALKEVTMEKHGEPQVVATGTSRPHDAGGWQVLEVSKGEITPEEFRA